MIFFKGVLKEDLCSNYIPGTVTTSFREALTWKERIEGKPKKGASSHIRHGDSCVISIHVDETQLLSHEEFQRRSVKEHDRRSCWTSGDKTKAQVNHPVAFQILDNCQIDHFFRLGK